MNEIPGAWIPASLLLFGGAVTALAAGAAILLAESWSQKMRQRREHFKTWQDRNFKIWQDRQRESFLWLSNDQEKRLNQEVNKSELRSEASSLMGASHSVSGASGSLGYRTSRLSGASSLPVAHSNCKRRRFFRPLKQTSRRSAV
jgi:hypothetical protein